MYAKPTVRKSLLAKMLTELLDTRIMVKQAMKSSKSDKVDSSFALVSNLLTNPRLQALLRVLDARQLSLKFICNVTYGYTSASFSGRMPAVEIADSIVQSGRETLEHVSPQLCVLPIAITYPYELRQSRLSTPQPNGAPRLYTATRIHSSSLSKARPRSRPSALGTKWPIRSLR